MKSKSLFILLLCTGLAHLCRAQSSDASLQGMWTIYSVELRQTIDLTSSVKLFNPRTNRYGFIQSPHAVTFAAGSMTLQYADRQESGTYRLQGNTLHVDFSTHPCDYTFILHNDGRLQLNQVQEYVINDDRVVHKAKDECKFYGRK